MRRGLGPASLLIVFGMALGRAFAAAQPLTAYDDALQNGFADWSWAVHDLAATSPVHSGTDAISFEPDAWGGLYFHRDAGIDVGSYDALDFFIHGGATGGQAIRVALISGGSSVGDAPLDGFVSGGAIPAGAWASVHVPFAALGVTSGILDGFWLQADTAGDQAAVFVDDVSLAPRTGPPPPPTPVAVTVDPDLDRHPISPLVYGVAFADTGNPAALRYPLNRWGGNSTTRYSWQDDIANHASDWFFYNIESQPDPGTLPDGSTADLFVDGTRADGGEVLLTVPLIGWTPRDRVRRWGFSVAKYGAQQSTECTVTGNPPWCQPDAGNGNHANGTPITGNDPSDTSRTIDPSFVTAWMDHVAGRVGNAESGGVRLFALDNEPDLWNSTHRDVHPAPLSYDEIWQRTVDYAGAIKAHDPAALTLGPVPWGWCAYFWSALDGCSDGGADLAAHGGVHYLEWYLQQVHDYETANGVRLVDYLDVHYYPQAANVALTDDESAGAVRLRSLKGLYDPSYVDESWIGQPVRLIPRLKEWIAARAPNTKLAITEYTWGGDTGISSAIAQAEALAIFGREGVDLAARWVAPTAGSRVEDAFRLYLDYDGAGSRVTGETARAVSANVDDVGAYAIAGAGNRLFLLLFNKATGSREADVALPETLHWRARTWGFDAATPLGQGADATPSNGAFALTLSARSATLVAASRDFTDVPVSDPFYAFVMTVADDGVSAGCGGLAFCPTAAVTRAQMAVFLLKAKLGASHVPPPATGAAFADVAAGDFAAAWIEELAALGVTGGCGGGDYCPNAPVTRAQMAAFLLKTEHGAAYVPPACAGVFADVACPGPFTNWIERLSAEGVTAGCGGGDYCPDAPNTRGQMAVFLTKTFVLQ
ncbi:MAG TPA: glycoside hydrolase family 44 protein [Thermoanaerobaculia bacterium]|nr:glycoside hydrolase family 44 protein [Thermoanaerobaculia bacterium]